MFDALPEETSSTAPSVSLTQSLEQTTEIPCLSSSSEMAHAKKDCRVATIKQYWLEHPEFYYCVVEKVWFCKTCVSFSGISSSGVLYIIKVGIFVDHRFRKNSHLESEGHKEAFKKKQSYDTLAHKQHTSIWKMLCEASLTSGIYKTNANKFILKGSFRITLLLVKQN